MKLKLGRILALALTPAMLSCSPQAGGTTARYTVAPSKELPPNGVEKVELGMTRSQVLSIMNPLYPEGHVSSISLLGPVFDLYRYFDSGSENLILIEYSETGRVDAVTFGDEGVMAEE